MQEFARTNLDVRHKIANQNDASQDLISRTGDASNQYRDLQCKQVVLSNKHGDLHAILGGLPRANVDVIHGKVNSRYIQCEAPKIAKLVYNSNNYGLWYV